MLLKDNQFLIGKNTCQKHLLVHKIPSIATCSTNSASKEYLFMCRLYSFKTVICQCSYHYTICCKIRNVIYIALI